MNYIWVEVIQRLSQLLCCHAGQGCSVRNVEGDDEGGDPDGMMRKAVPGCYATKKEVLKPVARDSVDELVHRFDCSIVILYQDIREKSHFNFFHRRRYLVFG